MKYILLILTALLLFSCSRETPVSVQGSSLSLDIKNGLQNSSKGKAMDWPDNFTAQLTLTGSGLTATTYDLHIAKQITTSGSVSDTVYRALEPVQVPTGVLFGFKLTAVIDSVIWQCEADSVVVGTTGNTVVPAVMIPTNAATLISSTNLLNFGFTEPNTISNEQTVSIIGYNLKSSVFLEVPAGFEISRTSGVGFVDTLSLHPINGNLISTAIFVRFKPTVAQTYSGNLSCNSGTVNKKISVSGTGMSANSAMVLINGGTFQMGQPDPNIGGAGYSGNEQPVHLVTLSSFYIGKYEVTQTEWLATMGTNPSQHTGDLNRPVEQVSWYYIMVYCNKRSIAESLTPCYTINGSTNPTTWGTVPTTNDTIWDSATCNWSAKGYRLPTEAEWEFAARGGNSSNGYTYSGSNTVADVAWYSDNSGNTTHAVGTKAPNELGLYDMSGNVYEWNWDWYESYNSSVQTNPTGATMGSYRVLRGGSYFSNDSFCRVAGRDMSSISYALVEYGFRLARTY